MNPILSPVVCDDSTQGVSLVVDPLFTNSSNFSTDLQEIPLGQSYIPQGFFVLDTQATTYNSNWQWNSINGQNGIIIDGNSSNSVRAWCQTYSLEEGKTYTLQASVFNPVVSTFSGVKPVAYFQLDGVNIVGTGQINPQERVISGYTFTATVTGNSEVCLFMPSSGFSGNDIILEEVRFDCCDNRVVVEPPDPTPIDPCTQCMDCYYDFSEVKTICPCNQEECNIEYLPYSHKSCQDIFDRCQSHMRIVYDENIGVIFNGLEAHCGQCELFENSAPLELELCVDTVLDTDDICIYLVGEFENPSVSIGDDCNSPESYISLNGQYNGTLSICSGGLNISYDNGIVCTEDVLNDVDHSTLTSPVLSFKDGINNIKVTGGTEGSKVCIKYNGKTM